MTEATCTACRRVRPCVECGLCEDSVCKSCSRFLDASTFSFRSETAPELKHTHYCAPCFETTVEPALEEYSQLLESAKEVYVFFTSQKKQIPLLSKAKHTVKVEQCEDRDETILRLAFFAAEQGYNALIQTEVVAQKVRNEGFQKSAWRGSALPATIDVEKFQRY